MKPEKVVFIPEYISEEVEQELLSLIPKGQHTHKLARNQILRYGSKDPYPGRMTSSEIPQQYLRFKDNIDFDHVTVNEYFDGQIVDFHVDSRTSGEIISVLSLGGHAIMHFRDKKDHTKTFKIELPPRSFVQMSGDARWLWEHKAKAIGNRYSVVFRKSVK